MNRSPRLMSALGWSSPPVPSSARANSGSTKLMLGSSPSATVSRNDLVVTGIPRTSLSPGANRCQNGKYFSPHSARRSEEHTSELQSRPHLVCRLLLEKKKKKIYRNK